MTDNTIMIAGNIDKLRAACRTLVLATVDSTNKPLASQTPFVVDTEGNFLVLVSALAEHGRNLKTSSVASVLLLQDETGLINPFARERLSYRCDVHAVPRDSAEWQNGEPLFKQRFGKFVDTLLMLPDFAMYRLQPVDGRYVAGFGAAYTVKDGAIKPIGPPAK